MHIHMYIYTLSRHPRGVSYASVMCNTQMSHAAHIYICVYICTYIHMYICTLSRRPEYVPYASVMSTAPIRNAAHVMLHN